jgi:hypothetical protein
MYSILFPVDEKVTKNQAKKKLLVSRNYLCVPNQAFAASSNRKGH